MSNTITYGENGFSVVLDGSELDMITKFPSGVHLESLEMVTTATDDILAVREANATGRFLFHEKSATAYDNKIKYFNTERSKKRIKLYVKAAEATSGVILIVELK